MRGILLILSLLVALPVFAQQHGPKPLSLNTILSCSGDPYVQKVLSTDLGTMRKLGTDAMLRVKGKTDPASVALQNMGFQTIYGYSGPLDFMVLAFHPDGTVVESAPYCTFLTVGYEEDKPDALPYGVDLNVISSMYTFDANELFLHADQFTFMSGILTASSDVYLAATKGKIIFVFTPTSKGLTLHRVGIRR